MDLTAEPISPSYSALHSTFAPVYNPTRFGVDEMHGISACLASQIVADWESAIEFIHLGSVFLWCKSDRGWSA